MREVSLTAQTMITAGAAISMDDLALRLIHHAAAARRRAEEERRAGDQDAVFFLVSLAIAIERDAARAKRVRRWNLVWRWVIVVGASLGLVTLSWV